MPYVVVKDANACSSSKPWAVKNSTTGDVRGRCHATKAQARDQQKALYAALRREGKMSDYFVSPVEKLFGSNPPTAEDTTRWVQAFPYDTWDHPLYGPTTVDRNNAQQYVRNFKENVRGQELAINYDHGSDRSKGNKAAGWIKDMEARDNGVFLKIDFTPTAVEELKNGEWKYLSAESFDVWTHPQTGQEHKNVIVGGGLTNKPWVKGMLPINFSEVMTEDEQKRWLDEQKEWEHSEPGTGSPPEPRTDEDGHDDPAITEGWRIDTPPDIRPKEGSAMQLSEGDVRELRMMFEVDSDDKLVEAAKLKFGEFKELKDRASAEDQEREFAEKYPQFWDEHNKLMERDRENSAKNFAESVARVRRAEGFGLRDTPQMLSARAQEELIEMHKKFSDGKATVGDFEKVMKTITNGGIVTVGEIGHSGDGDESIPEYDTGTATGVAASRKLFGEIVMRIKNEHPDWDYQQALNEGARKHPDLAEAYQITLPA